MKMELYSYNSNALNNLPLNQFRGRTVPFPLIQLPDILHEERAPQPQFLMLPDVQNGNNKMNLQATAITSMMTHVIATNPCELEDNIWVEFCPDVYAIRFSNQPNDGFFAVKREDLLFTDGIRWDARGSSCRSEWVMIAGNVDAMLNEIQRQYREWKNEMAN